MNKLIMIGNTGNIKCYLNISKQEAMKRFIDSEIHHKTFREKYPNLSDEDLIETHIGSIDEGEFEDEFEAYSVYL